MLMKKGHKKKNSRSSTNTDTIYLASSTEELRLMRKVGTQSHLKMLLNMLQIELLIFMDKGMQMEWMDSVV